MTGSQACDFARKPIGTEKIGSENREREAIRILLQVVDVYALDCLMWDEALASPIKDTEDALQVACAGSNHFGFLSHETSNILQELHSPRSSSRMPLS